MIGIRRGPADPSLGRHLGAAIFEAPAYLAPSAWVEHVPFAFWIVDALKPLSLVELGTHDGTAYFAFCQEIRRQGLSTRAHAIDAWRGAEPAGLPGEEAWERVARYNRATYPGFSTLLREDVAAAVLRFPDRSVDLLHIDGLHGFEAVSAAFDTWLPKLSDRAVVLLHDTQRDRGSGVFRLVERLRARYPLFEFPHGRGIAAIGVGRTQLPALRTLFAAETDPARKPPVAGLFARLGLACRLDLEPKALPPAPQPRPAVPGGTGRRAEVSRGPSIVWRPPAREVVGNALVTPGRRQPMRKFSGEVYRSTRELCPPSVRPSERAAFKHVPSPPTGPAAQRLAGHHLYAGPLFGIFGHDLVELTSRLWPLLTETFDGIVALKWHPGADAFQLKLDQTIATVLAAFGIGFRDVHVVESLTEVEQLTVPEPALHINHFGLPILGDCFRLVADHYRATTVFDGRGFYLSRTRTGSCRVANEPEIETAAQRLGLQVLHPQSLALPMQISLMRQARLLAGTDGSAMHLAAFARPGTRLLCFDTRSLVNQRIINDVAGLDALYVDVPPGGTVADADAHLRRLAG